MNEEGVKHEVEAVLNTLPENPLGLQLESVHLVGDRWWAFLFVRNEPQRRAEVWDALADVEERLADKSLQITVAAA